MKESITLRIGSYNLAAGRQVGRDMRVLGRDIRTLDLDLVGVQEVDQLVARSGCVDTMHLLSESSGLPHYAFFRAIDFQGGEYGIGILSRYPITATERHELPSMGRERRVLGYAHIDVNGTPVHFFVTHLSYEDRAIRTLQFPEVARLTARHTPFVLVGDFNTADDTEFAPLIGTATVNNTRHSLPTFTETGEGIDNMVYSADAWCFDPPEMLPGDHSDHHMLYARGTLQAGTHALSADD